MHMLSKKDQSSDDMEALQRSGNTTTVVTATGKVQTNEHWNTFTILISS